MVTGVLSLGKKICVLGDRGRTGADKPAELSGCKATFLITAKRSKLKAIESTRDRKQVVH